MNKHYKCHFHLRSLALLLTLCAALFLPMRVHAAPLSAEQYALVFDSGYYAAANPDVAAALGSDDNLLFQHFLTSGMAEGRQGCSAFNVYAYAQNNPDLFLVFGANLPAYYSHYITSGYAEGRLAVAQQPGTQQPPTQQTPAADPEINNVHALVNQYRKENGLSSLSLSEELNQAANIRAKEIREKFSHTRPDGSKCFSAMNELGISYGWAGENIALGQPSSESVMTAWMNSSGHRANILSSSFNKIGVGHFLSESGTHHWVQLFSD